MWVWNVVFGLGMNKSIIRIYSMLVVRDRCQDVAEVVVQFKVFIPAITASGVVIFGVIRFVAHKVTTGELLLAYPAAAVQRYFLQGCSGRPSGVTGAACPTWRDNGDGTTDDYAALPSLASKRF